MTLAPSCLSAFRRNCLASVQQLLSSHWLVSASSFVHVAVQKHITTGIGILKNPNQLNLPTHTWILHVRDKPVPVKDTGSQYCAVLAPEDLDNDWRPFAHFLQWKQSWLEEMEQNERRLQDQQNAEIIFQNDMHLWQEWYALYLMLATRPSGSSITTFFPPSAYVNPEYTEFLRMDSGYNSIFSGCNATISYGLGS